jgi:hypothetical protein
MGSDMKAVLVSAIVVLLLVLVSSHGRAQTTLEEYNYVTKGYKVQIESGLDMKKGYRFEDIHTLSIKYSDGIVRETEFKALFKDEQSKPTAILCIYTYSESSPKEYICIPQFNSPKAIWDSTYAKISGFEHQGSAALMWGLAKLSSYYSMK